jgi:glycosyltransferase involved in cell wall biosynthesis
MRVMQVHNHYRLHGGEEASVEDEATLLRAGGHQVLQYEVANPDEPVATARALLKSPWNRAHSRNIRAEVRRWRPEIAHVHNTWFSFSPSVIAGLAAERVPTVMSVRNFRLLCINAGLFRAGGICTDCVGTHPWRGVLHNCYRDSRGVSTVAATMLALNRGLGTWDRVDRFLAPSEFVRDMFASSGFEADRFSVTPNVVPDPGPRRDAPSSSRLVLYAGRLSPEKGIPALLEGWRIARRGKAKSLELVVVGTGPLREELDRERPEGVTVRDWMDRAQLVDLMLRARAVVFPSESYETFGRVIAEGFAAGAPALATDLGAPGELVRPLGPSWLVPPSDPAAWGSALERLTDDAAVDRAGADARDQFERSYSFEAGLPRLVSIYESVVAAHGTTPELSAQVQP